jgi:arginyl-tRNA synthetase
MVDLPSGKMKSREGTVVDADDIMEQMYQNAKNIAADLGKLEQLSENEAQELYETVGMGALKYFMLKVDPKKRMLFDPKESIDFNGNTGPFIQYAYARINSILRKNKSIITIEKNVEISDKEKELIKLILEFPKLIQESANSYSPALVANYIFEIVKEFNSYYQSTSILNAESESLISFRVALSKKIAEIIKSGMLLLGIKVPQRM